MARPITGSEVVNAGQLASHEGCEIKLKQGYLEISRGMSGLVDWQLRWPDGQLVDLTAGFSEAATFPGRIEVRFAGCDRSLLGTATAEVVNAATGQIRFQVIPEIANVSGVYEFQVGVFNDANPPGQLIFSHTGLLSVEHGLWGDQSQHYGPPTIREIRLHLRDTGQENDLLQDVEFDAVEILDAIKHPVMYWNEFPPTICSYTCSNFPWRHHWRNGIVAELLKTAAHHYMRNKMQASSGGLNVDDKNKDQPYLQLAQMYEQEWKMFVQRKKMEINLGELYGTVD